MGMELVLLFVIGVCVGSFLNVAVFRTHEEDSMVKGRSKCQSCEIPLGVRDLIPVVSYMALRGRCRRCKSVISWQYPLVELTTGFLFVLLYLTPNLSYVANLGLEGSILFLRDLVFVTFLILLFVYDLRYMLLPDKFTIPAMIVALLLNLVLGFISPELMISGAFILGGFFWVQYVISKGAWVGGGDIRLGALMGLMLGLWQGLVALFLAYIIGALVAVGLLATGKADRKTQLPFGVFLTFGTVIMLLSGEVILDWYLGLLQ